MAFFDDMLRFVENLSSSSIVLRSHGVQDFARIHFAESEDVDFVSNYNVPINMPRKLWFLGWQGLPSCGSIHWDMNSATSKCGTETG